jgi:hypothetical protein
VTNEEILKQIVNDGLTKFGQLNILVRSLIHFILKYKQSLIQYVLLRLIVLVLLNMVQ